ncbi:replication-relaxation family protein [Sorangium sp. So ce1151]|uniref:replication-relaxation family protein n=1 Tax=Sorangium sp. So ce1151 TaxID=3133332 RepID=UPI003F5D64EA
MTLAPGDPAILMAIFAYRYVTSGQLARRLRRSGQVIRRAIRKRLKPGGFVATLQRDPTEEAAWTLGPQGIAFVANELGCPVSTVPFPRTSTKRGLFWRHTMLVNDVRISFDLATESESSPIRIERTVPEWEVKPAVRRGAPHHERFVLSEHLKASDGITYWHRPDCLFLMHPKADGAQRVAVFLEADRNTESMKRIRDKMEAFWLYWRRQRFVDSFQAVAMRVLFVLDDVTNRRRIHSMQEELRQLASRRENATAAEAFRRCFRFARMHDLDETTVLAQQIWYDADDQPRRFFHPVHPPSSEPGAEVRT